MTQALDEDVEETTRIETLKGAPKGRYRAEVRHRRGWAWEAQLVTTHVLHAVGERGEPLVLVRRSTPPREPFESWSEPATVWGERWARWKARRMVAAAHRRDRREGQPWVET